MNVTADTARSASHRHVFEHLSGPFVEGARAQTVPLDGNGRATLAGPLRHPLLLLSCRADLLARALTMSVTVTPVGAAPLTCTLQFARHTEAGASLPVFATAAGTSTSAAHPGMTVEARVDGEPVVLSEAFELQLIEGLLGRTLYLLCAEKQRIRMQARAIMAARQLATASADALDRSGADLGVPRFREKLEWNAARGEPTSTAGREPDADYRKRLAVFRPVFVPSINRLRLALAREGSPSVLAPLGFTGEISVAESNADLAVALQLVASGPDAQTLRSEFLQFVQSVHLVKPGAALPTWAMLPTLERATVNAMLARLATFFEFPPEPYVARPLAEALDLVGRVRSALGITTRWRVLRAQDAAGGSRYELGLGVEVLAPPAAELNTLRQNLQSRTFRGPLDFRLQVLLDGLQARTAAEDPQGRWLLAACGVRTVHTTAGGLYLSHLPIHAMLIEPVSGAQLSLAAKLTPPGDGGRDAHLFHALAATLAEATAAGVAISVLEGTAAQTAYRAAQLHTTTVFERCGLRALTTAAELARAVAAIDGTPTEAFAVMQLDATLSTGLLANTDAAAGKLTSLVTSLRRSEMVAVLPLVSQSRVLLVVANCDLPGAVILTGRAPSFQWHVLPLRGTPGGLQVTRGARNRYFPPAESTLALLLTVAMVRRDREDPRGCVAPYEVKLDMPAGQLLSLPQFEVLMNLLHRIVPLGVVIDTRAVRERHVDPLGAGAPIPLVGRHAHAWRTFQHPRHVGLVDFE